MADAQHHGRTVVVGIDGSESALEAVRWGAAEAVRRNVALRVVTAMAWNQDHVVGRIGLGGDYREIMLGAARRQLAEAAASAARLRQPRGAAPGALFCRSGPAPRRGREVISAVAARTR
jgi:nucleotide-binding universal stress UspA family protein